MRRQMFILMASLIALAISVSLAVNSFVLSLESNVRVKHSCIKINNSKTVITFELSSPKKGKYRYTVSCNYTNHPLFRSNYGSMWAGGSFTYTLYVNLEPNKTLAVNIKIWWEDKLIDEVTHYVRAEGG